MCVCVCEIESERERERERETGRERDRDTYIYIQRVSERKRAHPQPTRRSALPRTFPVRSAHPPSPLSSEEGTAQQHSGTVT